MDGAIIILVVYLWRNDIKEWLIEVIKQSRK